MTHKTRAGFVIGNINDFESSRGYFIGQFMGKYDRPDLVSDQVEVAWKKLTPQYKEMPHYHKIGHEINILISGHATAKIDDKEYEMYPGSFLVTYPPTVVQDFLVHKDSEVLVIKSPSVAGDKYEQNIK